MKPSPSIMPKRHDYESLTRHCGRLIDDFMTEARRYSGLQARVRRERAYGVFIGWRSIVVEIADPETFFHDDRRFEALLRCPPEDAHDLDIHSMSHGG